MNIPRALALGLACIIALAAYQFSLGYSLYHPGERFFLIEILVIIVLSITPLVIGIRALVLSIKALIKNTLSPKPHLLTFCGLIVAMFLTSLFNGYKAGAIMRIQSAGQSAYMSLAHDIRAEQQKNPTLFKNSDKVAIDESYEERERRKLTFLETILPKDNPAAAQWPRAMLHVTIEANHIRIDRGSGMLGLVGVVILDQSDTLKLYSHEELAKNPYLPCYTRITDRLYMFESD
jgi:hypothetical protein